MLVAQPLRHVRLSVTTGFRDLVRASSSASNNTSFSVNISENVVAANEKKCVSELGLTKIVGG